MNEIDKLLEFIEINLEKLSIHQKISIKCKVDEKMIELHEKVISHFKLIKETVSTKELSINYIKQFQNDLQQTLNYFFYKDQTDLNLISDELITSYRLNIENQFPPLEKQIELLKFNHDFFSKLNFFNSNIVAVGANGSGKTTLSNDLKKYLPQNGVVISAQKVLIIPTFSGVSNYNTTNQKLSKSQKTDKSLKVTYTTENNGSSWSIMTQIGGEFQVLLDNLLAERSVTRNKFFDTLENGKIVNNVPITKLDKALSIWNSLIQHRILECNDGINITLKPLANRSSYPAHQMSDGEKVTLYLIAHILQAPSSGFIIIDEPEMYLHKTILTKLWDILEQERQDCIFIYLTHDLDFATSRATSKKVWIKSFSYPNQWEIENIPENELPEALLLELLGSRKNILFCEGKKGSVDEQIYNLIFPEYTITPVDNCFAVMNYTKAFNKLPSVTTKAFGLIDSDHHGIERLSVLEKHNIFSFSMTEPESLFLDERFLKIMAQQLLQDESVVNDIKKDIINLLTKEIELQISNYVSTKINYYFKDSHITKGNNLQSVEDNYNKFTNEIKIQEWYNIRKLELKEVIKNRDYPKILSIYNNKGLKVVANKHFKISDFANKAMRLLLKEPKTHDILRNYFPSKLKQ